MRGERWREIYWVRFRRKSAFALVCVCVCARWEKRKKKKKEKRKKKNINQSRPWGVEARTCARCTSRRRPWPPSPPRPPGPSPGYAPRTCERGGEIESKSKEENVQSLSRSPRTSIFRNECHGFNFLFCLLSFGSTRFFFLSFILRWT